jgi:hypothetical protein
LSAGWSFGEGQGFQGATGRPVAWRHQARDRVQRHHFPGGLAAHLARRGGIKDRLTQGYQVGGKTWRVHLDGYDFLPYFKGAVPKGPREEIYYFGQGGELNAVRWNDWKSTSPSSRATSRPACAR